MAKVINFGAIAAAASSAANRIRQQLYSAPPNTITGVNQDNWPTASQPVRPIGPEGSQPLGIPFNFGQNLTYTARPDAEYSAEDLKMLAGYPIARICIENVKDQLSRIEWKIQLKLIPGELQQDRRARQKDDTNVIKLTKFLERPNREQNWTEFLRPIVDDMLVIDAASILVQKTFSGKVVGLRWVPGDSIVRYIDDQGFTPEPPSPAYAQLWFGIPRIDFTTEQLVYKPRNIAPRNTISSYLYGLSPCEQIAKEIEVGMYRLAFVAAYYTNGSTPGVIQVVPPNTSPDKITEAMQALNSELAGNLAARRNWRMVQGFQEAGKQDQIIFSKEPLLSDPFDDLHIRKVCFAFGTSPQRLMRMTNRGSAKVNQESAEEEGMVPWVKWLKGVIDDVIYRVFNLPNYEIIFNFSLESDIVKRAQADDIKIKNGLKTRNEIREDNGDDPRTEPEADQLMITTTTGALKLGQMVQRGDSTPAPSSMPKPNKANGVLHQ